MSLPTSSDHQKLVTRSPPMRLWRLSVAPWTNLLDFWCHGSGLKIMICWPLSKRQQISHKSSHWHPMVGFSFAALRLGFHCGLLRDCCKPMFEHHSRRYGLHSRVVQTEGPSSFTRGCDVASVNPAIDVDFYDAYQGSVEHGAPNGFLRGFQHYLTPFTVDGAPFLSMADRCTDSVRAA